jgi:hypothetical protein
MPLLNNIRAVRDYRSPQFVKLVLRETLIPGQAYFRHEPKLYLLSATPHVNMGRLAAITGEKTESVSSDPQHNRH